MPALNVIGADTDAKKIIPGRLSLRFLGEDKKRYDLSLTLDAGRQALAALCHASSLQPRTDSGQVTAVQIPNAKVIAGVGEGLGAGLAIIAGPLSMTIALSPQEMRELAAALTKHTGSH